MQYRNSETSYGLVARVFHWLVAFMLLMEIIGGLYSENLEGEALYQMIQIHKSMALLVLLLICGRLLWRWLNIKPEYLGQPPFWQRRIADVTHSTLYFFMFLQPVSGILMSQSAGYDVSFFGWFTLGSLTGESEPAAQFWGSVHDTAWLLLLLFAMLHIGAALYHHFVLGDDTLRRMTNKPLESQD